MAVDKKQLWLLWFLSMVLIEQNRFWSVFFKKFTWVRLSSQMLIIKTKIMDIFRVVCPCSSEYFTSALALWGLTDRDNVPGEVKMTYPEGGVSCPSPVSRVLRLAQAFLFFFFCFLLIWRIFFFFFLGFLQAAGVLICNTLLLTPLALLPGLSGLLEVFEFVAFDRGVEVWET